MLKNIVVTAAVLGTLVITTMDPAAAQTVRRHLRCDIVPTLGINTGNLLGGPTLTSAVQATNNWSQTIAKGTTFSYRVNGRYYTYKSKAALAPNGKMLIGDPRGAGSCTDVWIPG